MNTPKRPIVGHTHEERLESADARQVDEALQKLMRRDFAGAEKMLRRVIAQAPDEYVNSVETDAEVRVKFWAQEDYFYATSRHEARGDQRPLLWLANAYPRAYYYLAYLAVERRDYQGALEFLEHGQRLEPDNANFLLEKAQALARLGQREAAVQNFEQVLEKGDEIAPGKRAKALRGKAVQLIELHDLDQASELLRRSLELEPDNPVAQNELQYIARLRKGGQKATVELASTTPANAQSCVYCGTSTTDGHAFVSKGSPIFLCRTCFAAQQKNSENKNNNIKSRWKFWQ